MNLFYENTLKQFFNYKRTLVLQEIEKINDLILNESVINAAAVDSSQRHSLKGLEIIPSRLTKSIQTGHVLVNKATRPNAIVSYVIPYSGDSELFKMSDANNPKSEIPAQITKDSVVLNFPTGYENVNLPDDIAEKARIYREFVTAFILDNLIYINEQIRNYNNNLKQWIIDETRLKIADNIEKNNNKNRLMDKL